MKVEAVVLAGRPNRGRLAGASSVAWEALIPVAGRPMGHRVVEGVLAAPEVERVVVVGPPEVSLPWRHDRRVRREEPGSDLLASVRRGLGGISGRLPVLLATADVPLLKGDMVSRFLARCQERGSALCYPVISRAATEARFPGVRRTYARFREGTFTGGNLVVLRPEVLGAALRLAERLVANRKRPLVLALAIGPAVLLRYVLGLLSLRDLERRMSSMLGFPGAAVECEDPEIGVDVDKPEDLELCNRVLKTT